MQSLGRVCLVVALLTLGGCLQPPWRTSAPAPVTAAASAEQESESALQNDSRMILAMNAAAVAGMYAPDGVWERQRGPLRGREAIRDALAATGGVQVLSNEMTTTAFSNNGPAVIQSGEFRQSVRLPDGKSLDAAGTFEATWIQAANGEWWIRRMVTRPGK